MGTRGYIVVEVWGYLYSHWDSYVLPGVVARALDRGRDRWDDDSYLARILFSQMMIERSEGVLEGTTGDGISASMGDGGIEVYVTPGSTGEVSFNEETYTFEDFIEKFKDSKDCEAYDDED